MCKFALFIIVALVPSILGQLMLQPIPEVNEEEVADSARALINEIWPKLAKEALENNDMAEVYGARLQPFEEAALQAAIVTNTRVGKQLQSRFTGKTAKYTRDQVITLVRAEYANIDVNTVGETANLIAVVDRDPHYTDVMAEDSANGLMGAIGFDVGTNHNVVVDLLAPYLTAVFILCLITPVYT